MRHLLAILIIAATTTGIAHAQNYQAVCSPFTEATVEGCDDPSDAKGKKKFQRRHNCANGHFSKPTAGEWVLVSDTCKVAGQIECDLGDNPGAHGSFCPAESKLGTSCRGYETRGKKRSDYVGTVVSARGLMVCSEEAPAEATE